MSLSPKSPLAAMGESSKPAVPALVRVTVFELLVVPISCPPKARLAGDRVTAGEPANAVKLAVAAWLAVMESKQVPVPEQSPLQPAKLDPEAAVAVSVTEVPLAKLAEHTIGQLIAAGLLLTLPLPVPASVTVKGNTGPLAMATVSTAKSVHTPLQFARLIVTAVMLGPV